MRLSNGGKSSGFISTFKALSKVMNVAFLFSSTHSGHVSLFFCKFGLWSIRIYVTTSSEWY